MYSLGLDIGSSSIKIALVDLSGTKEATVVRVPETEMSIQSPVPHSAEQDPDEWWHHSLTGIQKAIRLSGIQPNQIKSIGIAYQMHGLVLIDKNGKPLRPCIIWCDSRAVTSGQGLAAALDQGIIKNSLYNLPGNFTAAKLKWVLDNEADVSEKIHKILLPGDYVAFCMSGELNSTFSGMSEGILFDFSRHEISGDMLKALAIDESLIPSLGGSFDILSKTHKSFENATGIPTGTPISYRAGDQPNNAYALGVLSNGEAAGTGGTSGVIYTVSDTVIYDTHNRVNTFAHVNHLKNKPSFGTLLCINGTGILYQWMRQQFYNELQYHDLEALVGEVQSDGISFFPFGNGAERMVQNRLMSAGMRGLDFNRHDKRHLLRAGLEGVAFAFTYGLEILNELGIKPQMLRVGNDNLFQSPTFAQTLADAADIDIQVYETTGAIGAAKGAAIGAQLLTEPDHLHRDLKFVRSFDANRNNYVADAYLQWKNELNNQLSKQP